MNSLKDLGHRPRPHGQCYQRSNPSSAAYRCILETSLSWKEESTKVRANVYVLVVSCESAKLFLKNSYILSPRFPYVPPVSITKTVGA